MGALLVVHGTDASSHSFGHSDTYTFPNTNTYAGTYEHANSRSYGHSDTAPLPNTNPDAGTYEHINAYRHTYEHSDSYEHTRAAYSHANSYSYAHSDTHNYADCYPYAHSDTHNYADCYPYAHSNAHADTRSDRRNYHERQGSSWWRRTVPQGYSRKLHISPLERAWAFLGT